MKLSNNMDASIKPSVTLLLTYKYICDCIISKHTSRNTLNLQFVNETNMPKLLKFLQDIQSNIPSFSLINYLIIVNASEVDIENRKTYCLFEKKTKTNFENLEIYPIQILLKPLMIFHQKAEC